MSAFWAILWKDLVTEWRSRDRVVAMALFAMLVVAVFHFALPDGADAETRSELAPALLWVTYVFAALLGLNRAFAVELDNDALSALALAPVDRGWVGLGKAAASFAILGAVQALTALGFALFSLRFLPKMAAARLVAIQRIMNHQFGKFQAVGQTTGLFQAFVIILIRSGDQHIFPELGAQILNQFQGLFQTFFIA